MVLCLGTHTRVESFGLTVEGCGIEEGMTHQRTFYNLDLESPITP